MPSNSSMRLRQLLTSKPVVEFADLQSALGGVSRSTVFRGLKLVTYQRSYSHNGRYYAHIESNRFDRFGLFSYQGIMFSQDGSLSSTLVRLIRDSEAGCTQRELRELLQVRVQVALSNAIGRQSVARQSIDKLFVYLHDDSARQNKQLRRRSALAATVAEEASITDAMVISVLLTLLRRPGFTRAAVTRHLRGKSPPISARQVSAVFDRFELDELGEKGGS